MNYSTELKDALLRRMLPPNNESIRELPEKVTLKLPFSHQNRPKSNLFHPQNR